MTYRFGMCASRRKPRNRELFKSLHITSLRQHSGQGYGKQYGRAAKLTAHHILPAPRRPRRILSPPRHRLLCSDTRVLATLSGKTISAIDDFTDCILHFVCFCIPNPVCILGYLSRLVGLGERRRARTRRRTRHYSRTFRGLFC